ncbi:hypothetical protein PSEUBRA_006179 [Kalmanozyma brasiliensis GHG001]|uniref:Uncharacterized protein n=1 Tax=Kalmanozyma brasiliensis (strain GHG001) TaxID=1365824 RepID=V5EPJ0_KALBG|nr:uncharacterized protein PSEUBRA_006179 [Kalmanozyma brasiliensis GHG001]EST04858.1 hypothetical protein PSEUBRA_006179 [Kalmanozyma brasiliensis GHG001]
MWSSLRTISNPSVRTRRLATSTFFIATFAASILTVSLSASTILPCPAARSGSRGVRADEEKDAREQLGVGQKVHLTKKGGWIEIAQPTRRIARPKEGAEKQEAS